MKRREPEESTSYKEATTDTKPVERIPGPPQESGTMAANGEEGLGAAHDDEKQRRK